jgi:hypothetical protein
MLAHYYGIWFSKKIKLYMIDSLILTTFCNFQFIPITRPNILFTQCMLLNILYVDSTFTFLYMSKINKPVNTGYLYI